jgi:hypothetical protein
MLYLAKRFYFFKKQNYVFATRNKIFATSLFTNKQNFQETNNLLVLFVFCQISKLAKIKIFIFFLKISVVYSLYGN